MTRRRSALGSPESHPRHRVISHDTAECTLEDDGRGQVVVRAEERRQRILEGARRTGHVTVFDLAEQMETSPETVRRDLRVLEDHGLMRRTHGGAYPIDTAGFETTVSRSAGVLLPQKRRIAMAAAGMVNDADTLYLDEGFTPGLVAEELTKWARKLTVVTSSLSAAQTLAPVNSIAVLLLGGRVRAASMATIGHWATDMLSDLVIDVAILGTNGISIERGLTTPEPSVSAVKRKVVEASRRRLMVGVHTKFGSNSFCRFADVAEFETLVTDTGLSVGAAHRYAALGPEVVRA